jgi:hypothetical protein
VNHIHSPDTTDPGIEREIIAKGLTAPRVTPADLEASDRQRALLHRGSR